MDRPLYTDDTVARRSNENHVGVVDRTHQDVDTHIPYPGRSEHDRINCDGDVRKAAFNKFMRDGVPPLGTVLVRWSHTTKTQLIPAAKLILIDRSLLIGDVVKRNPRDHMSGVIVNTFTKCTLQPVCDVKFRENGQDFVLKGLPPAGRPPNQKNYIGSEPVSPIVDVPASELKFSESPIEEDLIIFQDWIGRVEHLVTRVILRLADNGVVEVAGDLLEHADERIREIHVGDIIPAVKGVLRTGRWIYGRYSPNTLPIGTVVDVRIIAVEMMWLERRIGSDNAGREPPAVLDRNDLESGAAIVYDRTRRPNKQTGVTVSNSELGVQCYGRVRFQDLSGACVKYDGTAGRGKITRIDRNETLGYDINVFDVLKLQTEVTVQWQDLSITHESSINLVPDLSIDDEHDVWPGEVAHLAELAPTQDMENVKQATKVGVVQTVDSSARMARIRWCPEASLQYSVDAVDSPGFRSLLTRRVGFTVGEEEELSLYDMDAPAAINVRRGDIVLISKEALNVRDSVNGTNGVDWIGEIVDTCLNGSLTVRLGAATEVRDVTLRREDIVVAVRSDGTDEPDDWEDAGDGDLEGVRINSDGEIEIFDRDEADGSESDGDGETDTDTGSEEDSSDEEATYEDENGDPMDEEDALDEDWVSDNEDDEDVDMENAAEQTPLTSQSTTPPDASKHSDEKPETLAPSILDETSELPSAPEPYLLLSTPIPPDHHFASKSSSTNPTYLKRIGKEHRILRATNNLPHGVYVRTWESRLDLLRVLFVGPAETPYTNAPFVVDLHLSSTFPVDPPNAFFHSWPSESGLGGGIGRVNPNLYEDGKICLSLLGTWESSKSEGWNAGRSTVLQVLVSLLGLVLVREPYFNEAGYEQLIGQESARRNSELYTERTFLRARTFIITALNNAESTGGNKSGTEGLEDVITWLYRDPNGPQLLQKCTAEVEDVLQRSEAASDAEPMGKDPEQPPVMSKGACIPLRRLLNRLREL